MYNRGFTIIVLHEHASNIYTKGDDKNYDCIRFRLSLCGKWLMTHMIITRIEQIVKCPTLRSI